MAAVFLKILNMSISATWMVFAVLLARLCLKKAPKWISVLLWALVGVRLICPFSLESVFSLIPSGDTIPSEIMMTQTPAVQTGVSALDGVVNPVISQRFTPSPGDSANPLQIWIPVCAYLWLLGVVFMLLYVVFSYLRLKIRLREATLYAENVYYSEISSPFVIGMVKPMIFLPYHIGGREIEYVVAHEKAHIQRKDHWWKPLGFFVLSIHWFNPIAWLAYILFCRDIELSCDENVVKAYSPEQRADYSAALLTCATTHHRVAPCPLAFGEGGVKARIKAVLHYKKPALWRIIVAVILCAMIAACGLTDPVSQAGDFDPYRIPVFVSSSGDLNQYLTRLESKLYVSDKSNLQLRDTGMLVYYRGSEDYKDPMLITDKEAVSKAETYLKELGLLPDDTYHTRVAFTNSTVVDINGGGGETSETVRVTVFFCRVFNGVDVMSDQEDGIVLSFDAQGIISLRYLWRNIETKELPKTAKPITAEQARQVYMDQWDVLHGTCCEPLENPVIFNAYGQFDGVSRPCWVVAEDAAYTNAWYIDAFSGEVLYG